MIDLEFTQRSDKVVLTAWKEYRDHLNRFPEDTEGQRAAWFKDGENLLATLLEKMGKSLGYEFDLVQIKRDWYAPQGHAVQEFDRQRLQVMLLEWLGGERKVSVSLRADDEDAAKQNEEFREALLGLLDGKKRIRVELSPDQGGDPGARRDAEQ